VNEPSAGSAAGIGGGPSADITLSRWSRPEYRAWLPAHRDGGQL